MMISEVQSSIYNDLGSLSAEMTEDIVLLSNENPKAVFTELKLLREKAGQERSPDVAYLTFLHRKYVDVAASQKDSAGMRTHEVTPNLCAWEIEPYRQSEGQKTGWAATRSKLFRFRTILAILSLIIFAVMSSAPYILHRDFNPNHHFHVRPSYLFLSFECIMKNLNPA